VGLGGEDGVQGALAGLEGGRAPRGGGQRHLAGRAPDGRGVVVEGDDAVVRRGLARALTRRAAATAGAGRQQEQEQGDTRNDRGKRTCKNRETDEMTGEWICKNRVTHEMTGERICKDMGDRRNDREIDSQEQGGETRTGAGRQQEMTGERIWKNGEGGNTRTPSWPGGGKKDKDQGYRKLRSPDWNGSWDSLLIGGSCSKRRDATSWTKPLVANVVS